MDDMIADARASPSNEALLQNLRGAVDLILMDADRYPPQSIPHGSVQAMRRSHGMVMREQSSCWVGRVPSLCATAAVIAASGEDLLGVLKTCRQYDAGVFYALGKGSGLVSLDEDMYVRPI